VILRKPFESAEEPLDLVALGVDGTIVGPGILAVGLGRRYGDLPNSSTSWRVSSPRKAGP
jgi:hypothetical protein